MRARPLAPRQALVRDVARQDVAERQLLLAGHRRAHARRDELALLETPEIGIERLVVLDQRPRRPRARRCGRPPMPAGACASRAAASRSMRAARTPCTVSGSSTVGKRVGRLPATVLVDDAPLVDQLAQDLLEEERVALGAREDRARESSSPRPSTSSRRRDELGRVVARRAGSRNTDGEVAAASAPGRVACRSAPGAPGTRRAAGRCDAVGDLLEQLEQRRVGPVDVVDHDDERLALGERPRAACARCGAARREALDGCEPRERLVARCRGRP